MRSYLAEMCSDADEKGIVQRRRVLLPEHASALCTPFPKNLKKITRIWRKIPSVASPGTPAIWVPKIDVFLDLTRKSNVYLEKFGLYYLLNRREGKCTCFSAGMRSGSRRSWHISAGARVGAGTVGTFCSEPEPSKKSFGSSSKTEEKS